jgi:hypothetical protein
VRRGAGHTRIDGVALRRSDEYTAMAALIRFCTNIYQPEKHLPTALQVSACRAFLFELLDHFVAGWAAILVPNSFSSSQLIIFNYQARLVGNCLKLPPFFFTRPPASLNKKERIE